MKPTQYHRLIAILIMFRDLSFSSVTMDIFTLIDVLEGYKEAEALHLPPNNRQ